MLPSGHTLILGEVVFAQHRKAHPPMTRFEPATWRLPECHHHGLSRCPLHVSRCRRTDLLWLYRTLTSPKTLIPFALAREYRKRLVSVCIYV